MNRAVRAPRAGDDAQFSAAMRAGFDIDVEYALQSLHPLDRNPGAAEHMDVRERPVHRRGGFVVVDFAAGAVRHDAFAVFEVWREYPMEALVLDNGLQAQLVSLFPDLVLEERDLLSVTAPLS